MPPTPLANALAQYAPPQQTPSTPLANALMEYASRVKSDFSHGLDESAQGFGEMMNGQLATGIPRTFLGGLGWMGSPVSGAVSPLLNPVLQPVAQGVHDYVGQPIENATGYPADLTTELALALALPKALHGAGKAVNSAVPYLASLGDAVGKRFGAPEGSYLSGPFPKAPDFNTPILGKTDNAMVEAASNDLPSYKPLTAQQMIDMEVKGGATTEDAMGFLQAKLAKNDKYYPADEVERALQILSQNPIRPTPRGIGPSQPPAPLTNLSESARNVSELSRVMAEFEANRMKARNAVVPLDPKSPISSPVGGDEGIIAYHGSPHTFDKFSMDKIGTGEGAQAYGHGLYFAENEGVAQSYRDALGKPSWNVAPEAIAPELADLGFNPKALEMARDMLRNNGGDGYSAVGHLDSIALNTGNGVAREAASAIRSFHRNAKRNDGSMYQVRLNVKPHELLDWDKPLSEQPKAVREAIQSQPEVQQRISDASKLIGPKAADMKGESAYAAMTGWKRGAQLSPPGEVSAAVSQRLKQAGIKGIKYKDAGSRDGQGGTSNYVIFDDKLIDILKRYGIPMTAGAGGAMMVAGQNMPPEVANQLGPQT